jgi:riboflavin synthase
MVKAKYIYTQPGIKNILKAEQKSNNCDASIILGFVVCKQIDHGGTKENVIF